MVETAMLKVFATEHLWTIINDTIQDLRREAAYFCNEPFERMDARRPHQHDRRRGQRRAEGVHRRRRLPGAGEYLKNLRDDLVERRWSLGKLAAGLGAGAKLVAPWLAGTPHVPAQHPDLFDAARTLAALTKRFGTTLPHVFLRLKDEATFAQAELVHERIADIAIDLYVSGCVLSRLDALLGKRGRTATRTRPRT